ncbi:MAG: aspartate--tRNA ligase, partial [Candidatus Jacksonbacteria bacterium]|nr:aspartate--tRNA ligase [Candidatus Jacksonbacteria bacterium]
MLRTHTCGELILKDIDKTVTLAGWVNSRRDHGGLIFIDLRDRYGITQCTFDPQKNDSAWKIAETARGEYVAQITGKVSARPNEMINKNIKTGEIEVTAETMIILTKSKTPPFDLHKGDET